jgi:hypothetical protein
MPAVINISCPECGKQIRAPASVLGKKIRCKGCDEVFVAREDVDEVDEVEDVEEVEEAPRKKKPAAKKPEPKKPEPKKPEPKKASGDEDANPYGVTIEDDSNRCPHCAAAMLSEDAIICVECGYNTQTREKGETKKTIEPTGMEVFLWLLPGILHTILSICIIVWFVIHWGFLYDWLGGEKAEKDGEWQMFFAHQSMRIWVTVPLIFVLVNSVWAAILRLAINNKPPEAELKTK